MGLPKIPLLTSAPRAIKDLHEWCTSLRNRLQAHVDEQQYIVRADQRRNGSDSIIRFLASLACVRVYRHVQSSATGGANYNPGTSISSTLVDTSADRQQDFTVTRNGVDRYFVWLIPTLVLPPSSESKLDGQSGRPDRMCFLDLGI